MAATGCAILLIVSWLLIATSKSADERQLGLIQEAAALMQNGIFIRAAPILEEAAGMDALYTHKAEEGLKRAYL